MDELEQIRKKIEDLQNQEAELVQKMRGPAIEDMKKNISLYGISANELGFSKKSSSVIKPVVTSAEVKYKQGEKTWTGRGRKPNFVIEHIDGGGKIEDLLVKME